MALARRRDETLTFFKNEHFASTGRKWPNPALLLLCPWETISRGTSSKNGFFGSSTFVFFLCVDLLFGDFAWDVLQKWLFRLFDIFLQRCNCSRKSHTVCSFSFSKAPSLRMFPNRFQGMSAAVYPFFTMNQAFFRRAPRRPPKYQKSTPTKTEQFY